MHSTLWFIETRRKWMFITCRNKYQLNIKNPLRLVATKAHLLIFFLTHVIIIIFTICSKIFVLQIWTIFNKNNVEKLCGVFRVSFEWWKDKTFVYVPVHFYEWNWQCVNEVTCSNPINSLRADVYTQFSFIYFNC